jgi:hypothetical protein
MVRRHPFCRGEFLEDFTHFQHSFRFWERSIHSLACQGHVFFTSFFEEFLSMCDGIYSCYIDLDMATGTTTSG